MASRGLAVSENYIIAAMEKFTSTDADLAVMNAVEASDNKVTEKVLLAQLHNSTQSWGQSWKDELIPHILGAIKFTEGELTAYGALKTAITTLNRKAVIAISEEMALRGLAVSENYIIAAMEKFASIQPTLAVMNAVVASGSQVTEAVLLAQLNNETGSWINDLTQPFFMPIRLTKSELTADLLKAIRLRLQML